MKPRTLIQLLLLMTLASLQVGMARHGVYDEEARQEEREAKAREKAMKEEAGYHPVKGIASGVKQAAVDAPAGLISDTVSGTEEDPAVISQVQGARLGSERAVDSAVKGVLKVATLGYADVEKVDMMEPEDNSGEPTKFKVSW